jgi:hypothetical protein
MSKQKPFDLEACIRGESVVTRDGRPYKFGAYNSTVRQGEELAGWMEIEGVEGLVLVCHTPTGAYYSNGTMSRHDLVMAPKTRTIWVRAYKVPSDLTAVLLDWQCDSERPEGWPQLDWVSDPVQMEIIEE